MRKIKGFVMAIPGSGTRIDKLINRGYVPHGGIVDTGGGPVQAFVKYEYGFLLRWCRWLLEKVW